METERRAFERFLDIIDRVLARVQDMHASAHDFGTGVPLYRAEIHTIRAIGENQGTSVTALAEHMGVTKGAVSQTVAKLVAKRLVGKTPAADSGREVSLRLTELGLTGYRGHEQFHMRMLDLAREYFGDEFGSKLKLFTMVMTELEAIMARYEQQGYGN